MIGPRQERCASWAFFLRDGQSGAWATLAELNEVAYGHGCWGRVILWSSGSPVQSGIPLAESHQPSCKSLIAKGTDSSSIAGRIGHFLQVAPIESAAARIFFRCVRISARGTPDRALTTWGYRSQIRFNFRQADRLEVLQTLPLPE